MKNKNVKIWWEVHVTAPGSDFTFVSVKKTREEARAAKRSYGEQSKYCKIFKIEERISWGGEIYRFNIHQ